MKLAAALGALALAVGTQAAWAEAAPLKLPTDTTLTQLIEESLAARPELAQSVAVVHAEQERTAQADAMPDPMLQLGIQNDGFTSIEIGRMETSYVSLMASQTFPWPGKLGLQKEIANLGVTQARYALARVRLSTEAEVRRAYADLLLVRGRLALLEQLDATWQKSSSIARVRYETAGGAQSDVLRAQLELLRLGQRRLGLEAEERVRLQAINRMRARPLSEPIVTTTRVLDLPPLATFEGSFSAERSLRLSPELASARLGVARADGGAALAKKSYYPDLTVGAGIMFRGSLPPMWLATVGGPIPIWGGSKQGRAVAENRAWSSAATNEVAALEQVLRWRTAERHAAFSALRQMVDLYQQGLLIASEATAESTLVQFKVGKVSFASVLEANAGLISDREAYLELVTSAYRILIAQAEISLAATPLPSGGAEAAGAMPGAGAMSGGSNSAAAESAVGAARGSSASKM